MPDNVVPPPVPSTAPIILSVPSSTADLFNLVIVIEEPEVIELASFCVAVNSELFATAVTMASSFVVEFLTMSPISNSPSILPADAVVEVTVPSDATVKVPVKVISVLEASDTILSCTCVFALVATHTDVFNELPNVPACFAIHVLPLVPVPDNEAVF